MGESMCQLTSRPGMRRPSRRGRPCEFQRGRRDDGVSQPVASLIEKAAKGVQAMAR